MREKVEIVEYKPEWPDRFEELKTTLGNALGDLAISIDHIGSTSVPDLAAKDRIDIQITISPETANDISQLNSRLVEANLGQCFPLEDHIPPGDDSNKSNWEKYYLRGEALNHKSNIHIRTLGKRNRRYSLLFRDYLRANSAAAKAYSNVKKQIARFIPHDRDAYCDIKDPVCDLIMLNAEKWAQDTGWKD